MDLTTKQAIAYLFLTDHKTTELGYGGAAGGGKSILGCYWLLVQCLRYPGTSWVMGRKELSNLKKTTLISFFKVVEMLGIKPEEHFILNSQTNIIKFNNGSVIFLMDMSHQPSDPLYTRFGGLELTGAFVDESNEDHIQAIEILKTRIGRGLNKKYKLLPKLLETFNPEKNHVYTRYYKPFRDKELPRHRKFIQALAKDNHNLDENYIKQLENSDKITRERLLYGNFEYDENPAKLIDYDNIINIFTNEYIEKPREQMYASCDIARLGQDLTVIMIWKGMNIIDIISMPKTTIPQSANKIKELCIKYRVTSSNVVIDEDGVGGGVVDVLRDQGYNVVGFINNSKALETKFTSKFHNYANLKTQSYFKLAEKINSGELSCNDVSPQIKELIIQDLEQVEQKDPNKDGPIRLVSKDIIKVRIGRSTDYSDAMAMRMYYELKVSYKPYISI